MVLYLMRYRRAIVVAMHLCLVALANYAAFLLRFDGHIPDDEWELFTAMLPWVLAVRAVVFGPFRLYQGLWRYTSLHDARDIAAAVVLSGAGLYVLSGMLPATDGYPRSVWIIDGALLILMMAAARAGRRLYHQLGRLEGERRVLVYGAGDAGAMIVHDMKSGPPSDYEPAGFIDDNPGKRGRRIHGVPVLGSRADLARLIAEEKPREILVAMPSLPPAELRRIVKALQPFRLPIKTLPGLRELIDGRVRLGDIRDLAIEDLLPRPAVTLDPAPLGRLIAGKRVLVTGAAGSIGSELCRQIARFDPAILVALDRNENGLFELEYELSRLLPPKALAIAPGDATDGGRVEQLFARYRPGIVFHAAAHKHVPMMQRNPSEAIKNNVGATLVLAEAALRHRTAGFVLISTDKAVRPTSVMGASKRLAEMAVRAMAGSGQTTFCAVRFGNVLGSNGSVLHRFMQQIKAGGPVTVTHPEMRRYFMLTSEAVHLVLHAAAMAEPGAIYLLEMGEQLSVLELARTLIRLSGYIPEADIPIVFTGVRPGEKLSEELVDDAETREPSPIAQVARVAAAVAANGRDPRKDLEPLLAAAAAGNDAAVIAALRALVPGFAPAPDGLTAAAAPAPAPVPAA